MSDFIRFRVDGEARREAFSRFFERLRDSHNARYLGASAPSMAGNEILDLVPEDRRDAVDVASLDDLLRRLESCTFMFEGCHFMGKGLAEVHVEAVEHPYGGLEALRGLIEVFGMKVLGIMEGGDFHPA